MDSIISISKYLKMGDDGIYGYDFINVEQDMEISLRKQVAKRDIKDYLKEIPKYHSIPVMDYEVRRYIKSIPKNGIIIDVGGCWGWHWRKLKDERPDIKVIILDFIRENLHHAKTLLRDSINRQIFLVHGDATDLKFPDETFDGYWSVQTLQHIPNIEKALNEGFRVLKRGGLFATYSLNDGWVIRTFYNMLGRKYIIEGCVDGSFWLSRASKKQMRLIEHVFKTTVTERWSEVLFKPELRITFPGQEKSLLGKIDSYLSNNMGIFSSIARQHSFHCVKQ